MKNWFQYLGLTFIRRSTVCANCPRTALWWRYSIGYILLNIEFNNFETLK